MAIFFVVVSYVVPTLRRRRGTETPQPQPHYHYQTTRSNDGRGAIYDLEAQKGKKKPLFTASKLELLPTRKGIYSLPPPPRPPPKSVTTDSVSGHRSNRSSIISKGSGSASSEINVFLSSNSHSIEISSFTSSLSRQRSREITIAALPQSKPKNNSGDESKVKREPVLLNTSSSLDSNDEIKYADGDYCDLADDDNDDNCCPICLCELETGEKKIRQLLCGHEFHTECIDYWLTTKSVNCPMCKLNILDALGLYKHRQASVVHV
ncbi:hypothetical protein H4219_003660 [Mycoemilia scoparia]|uniref:RING-type E3 ubiquitin transferase n=1 Tax=Mycoemilia scoparia TaxID=417184 RepID=A0A9W7ZU32_9FUNG|nr:hypothetical protein H4219_003660 [Mycoemilia scoparia]